MKTKIHSINYALLIICAVCLTSCQNKQEKETIAKHRSIIDTTLGKKLKLPTVLSAYDCLNDYRSDSIGTSNPKFKIYSRVNASCGTCVDQIDQWGDLSSELGKYNTSIILVCHSENNFEFIKHLCESGKIKEYTDPLYFDEENKFADLNSFMKRSKHFETVLTDRDDTILLMGNPLRSKAMKDLYIKEIVEGASIK